MSAVFPVALGLGTLAAGGLSWASLEARAYTVRERSVPVLPPGAEPIRVLHLSDLHLTPRNRKEVRWLRTLADLKPDLVVNTGDNLAHVDAVPTALEGLEPLLGVPGVFAHGSNDYYAPSMRNPAVYLLGPTRTATEPIPLPTDDLTRAFVNAGWLDLNNARGELTVRGTHLSLVGMDDPHLKRDRLPSDRGMRGDIHVGVVHAPYLRALEALRSDGTEIIFAGHTHGGQLCLPGVGALVTNCDLDRARARGLHPWPSEVAGPDTDSLWLHVSAGVGTSPFAPVRFACRPEAILLTLLPRSRE